MKFVPLAEAKAKLSGLVDEVARRDARVTITKRGRPKAVLMSHHEATGLDATLEIMADPEFYAEVLRGTREFDERRGRLYTHEELFGPEEGASERGRATASVSRAGGRSRPSSPTRRKAKSPRRAR